MLLPNILIVGAQKSGTTWLHEALARSPHIFAPKIKELNFFNAAVPEDKIDGYAAHFANATCKFRIESTPHYFRLPTRRFDTSENIARIVPDAHLVAILRNPVDRYLSAYIHHMMVGRFPYHETLRQLYDGFGLIELGKYADILEHWEKRHKEIQIFLYDDLVATPLDVVNAVGERLKTDLELTEKSVRFRTNDKKIKAKKMSGRENDVLKGRPLPVLSDELKHELMAIYEPQIDALEQSLGNDLQSWRRRSA